jgi:glucose/arabinose dehydrogenase/mono/diheme cytochrome c family protein
VESKSISVFSQLVLVLGFAALAAAGTFHDAPASARQMKNPYAGNAAAVTAGGELFAKRCASCHGKTGTGSGNVPSLVDDPTKSASAGEIFWFITTGSVDNGMPSWASLPEKDRWQIVTFVKSLGKSGSASKSHRPKLVAASFRSIVPAQNSAAAGTSAASPFVDFQSESPGRIHKITVQDLPAPYATKSAGNSPDVVDRPKDAWPQAPAGFKVDQFATGLHEPRLMVTAPNGDIFLAESGSGQIRIFRGLSADGKSQQSEVFASGLKRPYGIAFYPPGNDPQWVYVGCTESLVRFPYHSGDLHATGKPQHLLDLPGGGHWTRSIQFSPDGKKMFLAVGSKSNVDDPDTSSGEKNRANILAYNPDGTGMQLYAYGIRNPGGGIAIQPETGTLWCSVNERDGLGDNLVPDYITHVEPGGFYGWPWWYMGGNQDPRRKGQHPELKEKTIIPDVLLQPHNASLEIAFYEGSQFPAEYKGDIFASQHGSWNKAVRTGYEVIRVPLHQTGKATGEYQDFLTGFVVDNNHVWGRPVGVTVAQDGSLLVSDDASGSIWRVSYAKLSFVKLFEAFLSDTFLTGCDNLRRAAPRRKSCAAESCVFQG